MFKSLIAFTTKTQLWHLRPNVELGCRARAHGGRLTSLPTPLPKIELSRSVLFGIGVFVAVCRAVAKSTLVIVLVSECAALTFEDIRTAFLSVNVLDREWLPLF